MSDSPEYKGSNSRHHGLMESAHISSRLRTKVAAETAADAEQARQIAAFEKAQPEAKSIRIAGATHYIFVSNRDQVVAEIRTFLGE